MTFNWQDAAAAAVLSTTITGLLVFIFHPRFRDFVWTTIEGDTDKFDAMRRESIKRDGVHDQAATREYLHDELRELKETAERVRAHADSLEFLQTSIEKQGEELRQLPRIAASMEQQTKTLSEMTVTLGKIRDDVASHGLRFERWDGFMEGQQGEWDGTTDRRGKGRRHKDNQQ